MIKIQQIGLIAVVAIGVGALLLPGTGLAPAAFAHHHHYGSISIKQSIDQKNVVSKCGCDEPVLVNVGINNAEIK